MLKKNNLDEMQEQKLLKIEHNGCWLAFWGLLAAMVTQTILFDYDFRYLAGEWIVFMVLAVYLGVACARNGIWDRRLTADAKTNALVSLIAALVLGAVVFAAAFARSGKPVGSLAAGVITAVWTFALCFAGLSLAARYTKRRREKIEAEPEDDGADME